MIILEGTDLVGKTTLAVELLKYQTPFGPFTYRTLGLLPGWWNFKNDYLNMLNRLVVQDRFILSEWVYGRVCRNGTPLTEELLRFLRDHLLRLGALTVIMVSSPEILEKRYQQRGDDIYKLRDILRVNDQFLKEYENGKDYLGNVMLIQVTEDQVETRDWEHKIMDKWNELCGTKIFTQTGYFGKNHG